ncbi:MAG: serine protease [Pseudomonadota bacterium]
MTRFSLLGTLAAIGLSAGLALGSDASAQSIQERLERNDRAVSEVRAAEREAQARSLLPIYSTGSPGQNARSGPRVVGGVDASVPGAYEFTVRLEIQWGASIGHCGGALVAPEIATVPGETKLYVREWETQLQEQVWVVTAAHCVVDPDTGTVADPAGITVHGGERDRASPERAIVKVTDVIPHHAYLATNLAHDIALLKLEPVDITDAKVRKMRPIRMPQSKFIDDLYRLGARHVVNGWGRTSEGGFSSQILQTAVIPYGDQEQCKQDYALAGAGIAPGSYCAGWRSGGIDSCEGDSGSSVFFHDQSVSPISNRPILVGIVSWGIGCARPRLLGIYTNVLSYLGWIEREVAKSS